MKTIEERAKEYASKKADISLSPVYNDALTNLYEEGYIAGATEQKAIDEEVRLKKCDDMTEAEYNRGTAFADWYLKNGKSTPTYSDAIEWARKQTIDEVASLHQRSHPTWVRGLKQYLGVYKGKTAWSHPTWVRGLKLS